MALPTPQPGDWLYEHPENGQSLSEYVSSSPVAADSAHNVVYIQPLGNFTKAQQSVIQYTANYLQLFFNRSVLILPALNDDIVPDSLIRYRTTPQEQLLTTPILNYLERNTHKDGLMVMAITAKDLYPGGSFNFVFGQARMKKRVGVSSIYRYSANVDSLNYSECLERLIKTSSHEMGHMLSIEHCTNAICVMNGANSLSEADNRPNRLCSECLNKLQWNLKFDIKQRLSRLDSFFLKHKLMPDYRLINQDLRRLQ